MVVGLVLGWGERAWAAGEDAAAPGFSPQYAVYGELGGAGLVYSGNFEVRPIQMLSLRVGGAVVPLPLVGVLPLTLAGVALLFGDERHHLETGVNYVHGWISDDDTRFINPLIGYRYQRSDSGFLFRATLGPMIRANDPADVLPWVGVSFGGAGRL